MILLVSPFPYLPVYQLQPPAKTSTTFSLSFAPAHPQIPRYVSSPPPHNTPLARSVIIDK